MRIKSCFADISESNQVHLSWIVSDLGFVHLLAFKNEQAVSQAFPVSFLS
jgi:hypothetical protein